MSEPAPVPVAGAARLHGGPDPERSVVRVPGLDGVRALGILLVMAFHFGFPGAGGGFLGVDVFFVLSGFLITGLLLAEHGRSGSVRLTRFWGHRIRRLFPALVTMLAAVALYAWLLAPADSLGQLRTLGISTVFYVNNWSQISTGIAYFNGLTSPQPLLHCWSLAIEEQFYLVWPLLILLLMRIRRSNATIALVAGIGAVASAVEMAILFGDSSGLGRDYYGTDTRAQALLVGAVLAALLARPARAAGASPAGEPTNLNRVTAVGTGWTRALAALGAAALAGVLAMADRVSSESFWMYRGGFLLIAVATGCLIASVVLVPRGPVARLLSLRPVRYIGAISYGLYLWHWPIYVALTPQRVHTTGWTLLAVRTAASFAIAVPSYHLLEMPIRRGRIRSVRAWVATPVAVLVSVALVVASTATATASVGDAAVKQFSKLPKNPFGAVDPATGAMVPTVAAGSGGPVRLLLLGDSEASFLGFGLGPLSAQYGIDYAGDGVIGCGLVLTKTTRAGKIETQKDGIRGPSLTVPCDDQFTRWRADMATFHPDVVMLADGEFEVRNHLVDGRWVHLGQPAFDRLELAAIEQAVGVLRSSGTQVVLLSAPYYQQSPQPDGNPWPEDLHARVDVFNRMLAQVAAADPEHVVVADVHGLLDPGDRYTSVIDGKTVRYDDGIHVTPAGALYLAPTLLTLAHQRGDLFRAESAGAPGGSAPTPTTG